MLAGKLKESEVDMFAEMAANIQRWLILKGLNAQLYHFNQEYLRLVERGANAKQIDALLSRWRLIIVPFMLEAVAPKSFVNVEAADSLVNIPVQVVR